MPLIHLHGLVLCCLHINMLNIINHMLMMFCLCFEGEGGGVCARASEMGNFCLWQLVAVQCLACGGQHHACTMQHQSEPSRWFQAGVNQALGVDQSDASFNDQNYKIKGAGAVKKKIKKQTKTKMCTEHKHDPFQRFLGQGRRPEALRPKTDIANEAQWQLTAASKPPARTICRRNLAPQP